MWRTADERGCLVERVAVGGRHCHPREVDEAVVHREGVEVLADTDEVAAGAVDLVPDLKGVGRTWRRRRRGWWIRVRRTCVWRRGRRWSHCAHAPEA